MGKIYTKSGDKGETGLVGGSRVSKADSRIELYGEVDHLNSLVGVVTSLCGKNEKLNYIQHKLFDLGSLLACESSKREEYSLPTLKAEVTTKLESWMDEMDTELKPLKEFILPGGCSAAAHTHLCRSHTRKIERKLVAFSQEKASEVPENAVIFINRLSDFFFVFARYLNFRSNAVETTWKINQ